MTPEEFNNLVRQLVRQRSAALTEKQVDEIAAAYVEKEKASDFPLWTYSSELLISEYAGCGLDSMQRNEPHLFAVRPTPDQYVQRMIEAGGTLSPEERLSLARSVEDMDSATVLGRFAAMSKTVEARKPAPQPESAIARYQAKLKAQEADRVAGNRAVHSNAQRARMGNAEFNDLPPEQRINIARKVQSNGP